MKKNVKVVLMLMFFVILMPIFAGCPKTEIAKFKGVTLYENDKDITKLTEEEFEHEFTNKQQLASYVELLKDNVKSYKVEIKSHDKKSYVFNTVKTFCEMPKYIEKYEKFVVDSSYLKGDNVLYLEYTFYNNDNCTENNNKNLGTLKTSRVYTYLSDSKKLNNIINAVGGRDNYCNIDSNGNYNMLYDSNFFTQIAYSQLTYRVKRENKNLNSCYYDSRLNDVSRKYSKYGAGSTVEQTSLNFVKWTSEKSGANFPTEINSYKELIDWAKKNGRYYNNCGEAHEGDLVLHNWEPKDSQKTIGILYQMKNGFGMIAPTPMAGKHGAAVYDIWSDSVSTNVPYCKFGISKKGEFIRMNGISYETSNFVTPIPTYFTVYFDSNGGSAIDKEAVKNKETVNKPANPTKEGYAFVEWQLNGQKYNFTDPVTKDITLTAVWRKLKVFQVKINTNSETGTTLTTVVEGNKLPKPSTPTKEGYRFIEWQLDGQTYDFNQPVTTNMRLDAKWVQKNYTLSVELVDSIINPNRKLVVREDKSTVNGVQAIKTLDGFVIDKTEPFNISSSEVKELANQVIVVLKGGTEVIAKVVIVNN